MTSLYPRSKVTPHTRATAEQVNAETGKIQDAIDTLSQQIADIEVGEGTSRFTWTAWADSIDGRVNFSIMEPANRSYIGMAYNKLTATRSEDPADYQWARFRGTDGQPGGVAAYLTNEMHNLPADAAGNVLTYAGATGEFKIYVGLDEVSSSFILSTIANPEALTVRYTGRIYTVTDGLDADERQATLTIRATGTGAFEGVIIDKMFSLAKAPGGLNAKTLTVWSDRQTISYDAAGAPTPTTQTTTFSTNKQNTTAMVNWSVTDANGVARTPVTNFLSAATGNSVTMSQSQFAAACNGTSGVIVTASITDGATIVDRISVVRVQAGAKGADGAGVPTLLPSNTGGGAIIIEGDKVTKAPGANGWNACAYSKESYGSFYARLVTANPVSGDGSPSGCRLGVTNAGPTGDPVHFMKADDDASCQICHNGSVVYTEPAGSWPAGTILEIVGDSSSIKYYVDGTLKHTGTTNVAGPWRLNIVIYSSQSYVATGLRFGPSGPVGDKGDKGDTGAKGADAIAYVQEGKPGAPANANQLWVKPSTKQMFRWNGSDWVQIQGNLAQYDQIASSALIGSATIVGAHIRNLEVENAHIKNLTLATGKVANDAISKYAYADFGRSNLLLSQDVVIATLVYAKDVANSYMRMDFSGNLLLQQGNAVQFTITVNGSARWSGYIVNPSMNDFYSVQRFLHTTRENLSGNVTVRVLARLNAQPAGTFPWIEGMRLEVSEIKK